MKKIIAIALTLIMVLSMVSVFVTAAPTADSVGKVASGYAPAGTGVSSLAEVTDPAGSYYLKADVTVDATIPVAFTGTLDGNGHTITVSAPLFSEFNGTVKNLTLAGAVDYTSTASHCGVLAVMTTGKAVITNVKNTAVVKGYLTNIANDAGDLKVRTGASGFIGFITGSADITIDNCINVADINGYAAGGFIGYGNGSGVKVVITNCANTGKISTNGATKATGGNNAAAGGFYAMSDNVENVKFENCTNSGEISSPDTATNAPVGGIVGYLYGNKNMAGSIEIINCLNTATVTGANQVGGIAGQLNGISTVKNTVNKGNVTSTGNYASGLVSRVGADNSDKVKDKVRISFYDCVNYGNVKSGNQYASGIASYVPWAAVAERCVNYGNIESTAAKSSAHVGGIFGFVGWNNSMKDCYNYGNITGSSGGNYSTGGVIGRSSHSGGLTYMENCGNFGDVTGGGAGPNYGPGGVLGYVWGGSEIKACFNVGKVIATEATASAAGIVNYFNSVNTVITYCFNAGELSVPENSTGRKFELWYNKAAGTTTEKMHDNYYLAGDGKIGYMEGDPAVAGTAALAEAVSAEDFKSGKLCYDLNQAIGSDVFRQTLGEDATPTTLTSSLKVIKTAEGAYENVVVATGDSTLVVVFALLAVSTGAVLTLKKKNSVR